MSSGNEFYKVLKLAGIEESQISERLKGEFNPSKIAELLGFGDDKIMIRALMKIKTQDEEKLTRIERGALASAFIKILEMSPEETQKIMLALRRVKGETSMAESETKKDACYHKVKSRYKIWPSAYGSAALTRCRKVGAKNWGNKAKK